MSIVKQTPDVIVASRSDQPLSFFPFGLTVSAWHVGNTFLAVVAGDSGYGTAKQGLSEAAGGESLVRPQDLELHNVRVR